METTFDKFITNDAKQKALFDKEYADFIQTERILESFEQKKQTVVFTSKNIKTARRAYVSV